MNYRSTCYSHLVTLPVGRRRPSRVFEPLPQDKVTCMEIVGTAACSPLSLLVGVEFRCVGYWRTLCQDFHQKIFRPVKQSYLHSKTYLLSSCFFPVMHIFSHSPSRLKNKTYSQWLIKEMKKKFDMQSGFSSFLPKDSVWGVTLVHVSKLIFEREET